jgi:hypothetical protein
MDSRIGMDFRIDGFQDRRISGIPMDILVSTKRLSKQVVCKRGFAAGHGLDVVVARREPGDPGGFAIRTPCL